VLLGENLPRNILIVQTIFERVSKMGYEKTAAAGIVTRGSAST
jgi:hypothetical protein